MDYAKLPTGRNVPTDVYALIEIAKDQGRVKYEFNTKAGVMMVDRLRKSELTYPVNYGCIPQTISDDGDPLDILVLCDPLQTGTVIAVRPVAVLIMEDEKGKDVKIIAVPSSDVSSEYDHIQCLADLPVRAVAEIEGFFKHYKDKEGGKGKYSIVSGWEDLASAHKYINESIARANPPAKNNTPPKPNL